MSVAAVTEPKIVIPDIATAPPAPAPAAAPVIETRIEGTPETPPPGSTPPVPAGNTPEAPVIETEITGRKTTKTPAEFAAERREKKEEKRTVEDLQRTLDSEKVEWAKKQAEWEERQKELDKSKADLEEARAESKRLRDQVKTSEERYFQNHQPTPDLTTDDGIRKASTGIREALSAKLPTLLGDGASAQRVFIDQILDDPAKAYHFENVAAHYHDAVRTGNSELIDTAISAAAQMLGVPDVLVSTRPDESRLLGKESPLYRQIDTALRDAMPHVIAKARRITELRDNAPQIEKERITKKTQGIRTELHESLFIPADQLKDRLTADPRDSAAIFAAIIEASPHLKPLVEEKITAFSEGMARIRDGIDLPLLGPQDAATIAEHRQNIDRTQQTWKRMRQNAIIGEFSGLIFATLTEQLRAAEARANAAASNTNPGSSRDLQGPPAAEKIQTEIMPGIK